MDAQQASRIIAAWDQDNEAPVELPASVLPKLTIDDLPDGITLQIGTKEKNIRRCAVT
jgi:hypothetical protein